MSPPNRQRDFLDYGDTAVDYPIDVILDNPAAAEPLKKRGDDEKEALEKCKKKARGRTLIIVAGGWHYKSTKDEIFAIKHDTWSPTTTDFLVVAGPNAKRATTAKEFLQHIARQQPNSLARVVFIGHGGIDGIKFSGDADTSHGPENLDTNNIPQHLEFIKNRVRPKLHKNARIELVTCTNGADEAFMDAMANAFDRCIKGFDTDIEFRNPTVSDSKISDRGLTRVAGRKKYKKGWRHLRFSVCVCT
jgi:hypothetical protein